MPNKSGRESGTQSGKVVILWTRAHLAMCAPSKNCTQQFSQKNQCWKNRIGDQTGKVVSLLVQPFKLLVEPNNIINI